MPLLPVGVAWPRTRDGVPLSLVGQLNTDEVNKVYGEPALPGNRLLSFFYEVKEQRGWGYDPEHRHFWRVIASDPSTVESATAGSSTVDPAAVPDGARSFPSIALAGGRVITVPDIAEQPVLQACEHEWEAAESVYDRVSRYDPPRHRVFGWPELVQDPMPLECQLASNGIYLGDPAGYRDPRVARLRAGAADWSLLWQIDTDDEAGWMWDDLGTIYFWIRRQDLATGAFDRVWMVHQSG